MANSHLTVLESSSRKYPDAKAFLTPKLDSTGRVEEWRPISYTQFHREVELFARHWRRVLGNSGIPTRSVIGMWLIGSTYLDVLHLYAISRAGYVPQLFSIRLLNPVAIYELLLKANAAALIYDSSFESVLGDCHVPRHRVLKSTFVEDAPEALPSIWDFQEDDIALIFHTSGSTSGSPKLVPQNYRWLTSVVVKSHYISMPENPRRQDVTVWMGSMCHIGQIFTLIGSLQHGSCVIQPTGIAFSSEELIDMISRCRLNRLNQFPVFLKDHFKNARQDPKLLSMLKALDDVIYSGMPLPAEDEDWALHNGIKLRNAFGSTEVGCMLLAGNENNPALLRPLQGTSYRFDPFLSEQCGVHQSSGTLHELVILSDSPDCPDVSLRSPDGHFHTGDLFQEILPARWISRGRDDDWIKSEDSFLCDTKAIEDNTRAMCPGLIVDCIVVGTGRPSPVLFVEPAVEIDHQTLKKEILQKTGHFHSRRGFHERITCSNMIVIVPPQSLPRTATKGNIRRKAVEEAFKDDMDRIFANKCLVCPSSPTCAE